MGDGRPGVHGVPGQRRLVFSSSWERDVTRTKGRRVVPDEEDVVGAVQDAVAAVGRPVAGHAREAVRIAAVAALHPLGVANRAVEGAVSARCRHNPTRERLPNTPVLLVHGCGANKSSWIAMTTRLRRDGYVHIETMNYNPLRNNVATIAERLVRRVDAMRARTGSAKVHLIGHSLGGIIVRYAITELGLDTSTSAAISIASPHGGTRLATIGTVAHSCGLLNAAADIAPGAAVLALLDRNARRSSVHWTAYYSNLDLLVSAKAAQLRVAALAATNILVPDAGHIGLVLDRRLLESVTSQLRAAEALDHNNAVVLAA